jgi:hypothetical protein
MSETVRRSLVLGARRPLTARAAAILALLAAVGALACGAPTEPDSRMRRVGARSRAARNVSNMRRNVSNMRLNDSRRSDSTAADTARAAVTPTVPWF